VKTSRKMAVVAVAAALVLGFSACTTGDGTTDSGDGADLSAEAQAVLDGVYEGVGSDLSNLEPVTPTEGLTFYSVSCGEAVPSCAVNSAAMKTAAESVGWSATIADGKLNPEGFATAIRQAVAGGADVISPVGIGCGVAQAAFQEAVDAGAIIVGGGGVDDCDPKLWASERLWQPDTDPKQQWELFGAQQADYVWGSLDGDVNAIVLNFTTQVWGQWLTDGFSNQLAELGSGEVVETIDISDPETADGSFIQKVTTAILSHPEANALIVPIDGWLANGLAAALVSAGVDEQLVVVGRGGDEPVLDLIRQGGSGVDATIGFAYEWGAWGSIDTALRVLAGLDPIYVGEPSQAIDAEHNLPDSGAYQGNVDYQALFQAAWGVD
jgi:ribose transport system substrate-binding protein